MTIPASTPIFTLGPQGTFSDEAAQLICGPETRLSYTRTFVETFQKLEDHPEALAVLPIENSVAGMVDQVQELLVSKNSIILGEINLLIRYALISNCPYEQVERVFTHPQAFEQTIDFSSKNFPDAKPTFTNSNTDSGVQFLDVMHEKPGSVAIVPIGFAQKFPEWHVASDIQDYPNNTTRFMVFRKRKTGDLMDFSCKKTSLFVEFSEDHSGMLYEMLSIFKRFDINLCRLESRPSKKVPWMYVFYVDFYNSLHTPDCLSELNEASFQHKILGSYNILN
ncbi:MAG: hypothetical protein HQM11_15265 [SAR324 cluster bacterium]|nr:hypothetical protein [SAR324 cluster bacterium]